MNSQKLKSNGLNHNEKKRKKEDAIFTFLLQSTGFDRGLSRLDAESLKPMQHRGEPHAGTGSSTMHILHGI
jgi:hypothetical protein